jgi:succinoglycan biosynthesis transport protein ExoP
MLQAPHPQSAVDSPMQSSSEQRGLGDAVDLAYGILQRHYLIILFITLLAVAAGVTFILVTPPMYTTYARVMIGTQQKTQFIQQQSILTDGPIDLEGQIQILQSRAIASSVVEKLKLTDDPEFASPAVGFVRRVFNAFTEPFSTKPKLDPTETAMVAVSNQLTVGRVGGSLVIEIGFSSQSREKSAQIANAVANAYIADQAETKRQANRTASEWLQERLIQLGQQNAEAERAVLAFKQEHNIVAAAGKRIDEQSLTDLNARLVAARTQTSDLLARLNIIESSIRNWNSNTALDAAISDTLTNPILTNLRQQYLDVARREAEYSARFGRDHLAVVNLRNKMRDLRSSTFDELRRMAAAFKSDYEIAKQRQAEVERQLDQVISQSQAANKAQVALRGLESTATTYQSLYESFLQRQMAGVQGDSFPLSDAPRLISLASASESKSKPKPSLVLALSLMGGIALGVGAGLLRDSLDRVFRTGDQVWSLLQMPCIALVPLLKANSPTRSNKRTPAKALGPRTITRDSSMFWRAVERPLSAFAESIRSISLAASLDLTDRPNKVIGLTSSLPNEGKSTIATAFAQLAAQMGRRVILVDCDLRNPTLSRCLAPSARIGIVDVISGVQSLEQAVWRDPATNLVFLPTGEGTPRFHSSEVLGLEQTRTLVDTLRASFDLVIVDLPPLAPVVDVRAAAHLVDGMILVIEWGRTKIDVVEHVFNNAPNVHDLVIGAVLNKTDMRQIGRYDTHRKHFYINKHYTKYGYSEG